ncbi:substrate-binding periplasmic protein [Bdellovibrio sp. HCB337]|uniref:substrate-binding periplasmic protein n=1 Tax=Bdellovibrio sp. HCB337 TaxID=3394358 RepID=UPI0039A4223F
MKILLALVLSIFASFAFAETKLKIGIDPLMPYLGKNVKGEWEGFLAEIFNTVGKNSNVKFQFIEIPLPRQVQSLQKREVDFLILPGFMVRYLPDVSIVSAALGVSFAGALTTLPEDEVIIDFEDLAGKSILLTYMGPETDNLRKGLAEKANGTKKTSSATPGGNKNTEKATEIVEISGYDITERMMLMMNDQRADVALGDYNILRYSLLRAKLKNIRLVPTSLTGFSPIILVSWKGHKDFPLVDRQMKAWFKKARKNGELQKMLNKYNLEDWQNLLSH